MAYIADSIGRFGFGNYIVRWIEVICAVLVLVFGGVLPYKKIGHTGDLGLEYDGIYATAAATKFTLFAGAFGTATTLLILILCMIKYLTHQDFFYWIVLVLDILNWIIFLVSWATIAAALSSTLNALKYCNQINTIVSNYQQSITPKRILDYLTGIQWACRSTYVGLSFAIVTWYSPFQAVADRRLLFFVSIYFTGKRLLTSPADEAETESQTTVERKEPVITDPTPAPIVASEPETENAPKENV